MVGSTSSRMSRSTKFTCPLRAVGLASDRREGLDDWVEPRGPYNSGTLACSYCGSMRPEEFLDAVKRQVELVPTDKNYKAYLTGENRSEFEFFFAHFDVNQARELAALDAAKQINFAFPGRFYVKPFFMVAAEATPFSFWAIVRPEGKVPDGQLISFVEPAYTSLLLELARNPKLMYEIDPRKWEEIIAAGYDKEGFDEVILTRRSGDLGRDVIAIKKGWGSVKFIEQVKAYNPHHIVKADEVRSLLGVLAAEPDANKAIFTTTSSFAPGIVSDRLLKRFMPYRLELVDGDALMRRLIRRQ